MDDARPFPASEAGLSPAGEPREELAGSVKAYSRHLVCCMGATGWPAKIEECHPFAIALKAVCADGTKITFCDARSAGEGIDVLDFPAGRRFLSVTIDTVGRVADGSGEWTPEPDPWIFVCVHGKRDQRCGQCGPPVARRMREEIEARGLSINVAQSSHLGGHHFTANVIAYPSGNWYGYVTPDDVANLLRAEGAGDYVPRIFRGRAL